MTKTPSHARRPSSARSPPLEAKCSMTVTMMTTMMSTKIEKLEVRRKNPYAKAIQIAKKYIAYAVGITNNIKQSSS